MCNSKEFIKKQEASRLLSRLEIKTPLSKIPLVGLRLFQEYKMNDIVNKFFAAGDKFMPEIKLRLPGLACNAFEPFTKNKGRVQKIKVTEDSRSIC